MISARTREAVSYWATCTLLLTFTLGCTALLIYMGLGFMRRLFG